jgi:CBS-domain-containing membrane protein
VAHLLGSTDHAEPTLQVRRLPIVDEDSRLVGIVTLDGLLKLMGHALSNLAEGIQSELVVT